MDAIEWKEPKTDWYGTESGDGYVGDRFNTEDYNRIKNNITYLHTIALAIMQDFEIADMGADKGKADYFFADEINTIESNLDTIAARLNLSYGTTQTYYANGKILDFNELNRIESATLDMYNKLINQYRGRRMFTFLLGDKGGF